MKKRILIISDVPAFPPNAGNRNRIWTLRNNLQDLGHEVGFLGLGLTEEQAADVRQGWGEHAHNIPKIRARQVRPLWYALMWHCSRKLVENDLLSPGVDHWYWRHWDDAILEFAASHLPFDVVIVEYVFFSKALENFPGSVLKILDAHDVFTGRREMLMTRKIRPIGWHVRKPEEEARGLNRADVVIGIQDNESKFFREIVAPSKRVITVGHTVKLQPVLRPAGNDIVFLGSAYSVNVDGIAYFIENCLPRIRAAVPDARLLIAGMICGMLKQLSVDGVELLGEVDDVLEAYRRAAVMINPVRAGTGLKIKTIEALASGRPLVTTSWGADGLHEGAGSSFLMADDPAEFADQIISVLTKPDPAEAMAQRALKFVEEWNNRQLKALSSVFAQTSA